MNLSEKDYSKLYQLQDKFLSWWAASDFPFYLTGGTALGRFYLHHRLSEDLDFFINADDNYLIHIAAIKNKISAAFKVNIDQTLFSDDFTRLFIAENDTTLKIEFVNDAKYYAGVQSAYQYGRIDTPTNILANKLTALIGRDEPKDIFDIIEISLNYSFNWMDLFHHAKHKAAINEIDVEQRLVSFPVELLVNVNWINKPIDLAHTRHCLNQIADDFFLGKTNSLGINKPHIESAKPLK